MVTGARPLANGGMVSFGGGACFGGAAFLFLSVLAIGVVKRIKIQYYKSRKIYPVFAENLFSVLL
jgi:hypothetical protein